MKTLDEVIKANECCDHGELDSRCEDCPYSGIGACLLERELDALHYLKEYQGRKEALRHWNEKAISEQQNIADAYMLYKAELEKEKENLPLTWDELREMKHKPVWVEDYNEDDSEKRWYIVEKFEKDSLDEYVRLNDLYFSRDSYGAEIEGWKAYRKERKND